MKIIFIACFCIFVFAASFLLIAIAIEMLDGTDFMDAIAEWITTRKDYKEVDVVRCKDCDMWKEWNRRKNLGSYGDCTFWALEHEMPATTKPNDFCSYAKRKGGAP